MRTLPEKSSTWLPDKGAVTVFTDDPVLDIDYEVTDANGRTAIVQATVQDTDFETEFERTIFIETITSEDDKFDIRQFLITTEVIFQGWGRICFVDGAEIYLGDNRVRSVCDLLSDSWSSISGSDARFIEFETRRKQVQSDTQWTEFETKRKPQKRARDSRKDE